MSERPPDIIEIGAGELVFLAGAIMGMGIGLAIAENMREWLLRGLQPAGIAAYGVELAVTVFATVLGGLWAALITLGATILLARLLGWYYRRQSPHREAA